MSLLTRLHNLSAISRDPIYKWRLDRFDVPLCGPSLFLVLSPYPVQIRCLRCKETVINLATVSVVKQLPIGSAYELSTYGATFEYSESIFIHFSVVNTCPEQNQAKSLTA